MVEGRIEPEDENKTGTEDDSENDTEDVSEEIRDGVNDINKVEVVGETDEDEVVGETDEGKAVDKTDKDKIGGETDEGEVVGETDEFGELADEGVGEDVKVWLARVEDTGEPANNVAEMDAYEIASMRLLKGVSGDKGVGEMIDSEADDELKISLVVASSSSVERSGMSKELPDPRSSLGVTDP